MLPIKDNIPTDRLPIVTILLIAANVLVYVLLLHGGIAHGPRDAELVRYGAIPYELSHPGRHFSSGPSTWLTPITSLFVHGGLLQLLASMLFLWLFGANVEDAMSRPRFLAFYLLGGLAATGLLVLLDPGSTMPAIGAAGGIAAVAGGYILLYPRARFVAMVLAILSFTLIELPAGVLLGAWIAMQAIFAVTFVGDPIGGASAGVALLAQLGAFAFGLLAIRLFAQRRKGLPSAPGIPVLG